MCLHLDSVYNRLRTGTCVGAAALPDMSSRMYITVIKFTTSQKRKTNTCNQPGPVTPPEIPKKERVQRPVAADSLASVQAMPANYHSIRVHRGLCHCNLKPAPDAVCLQTNTFFEAVRPED